MRGQALDAVPVDGVPNVVSSGDALFTVNSAPGTRVYDEELCTVGAVEYRRWDPARSKLAAYLLLGGPELVLSEDSRMLYLGAASGTTASHVADILSRGVVYCVEVSQRSFRDLLRVCESRPNMIPILADAESPEQYDHMVAAVDFLYQDIAQRLQVDIFMKNLRHFDVREGMLMVKSRSIDVSRDPAEVYGRVRGRLSAQGLRIRSVVDLRRYSRDHAAMLVGAGD
ncbi:MAG: fibrillarin-like rRNA/tRNA 2'-O-methyltransferase [Methanobacteriota archaeon]|nr:MAG: fibrillarin-like rRNA/tRNA 2'-O-methyltransferase [Euryarchaeota archaeon]